MYVGFNVRDGIDGGNKKIAKVNIAQLLQLQDY
jgi:hypothetical protein